MPEEKKKKKRWIVVVGILAVVLVAAGVGGWVWHEQPSFCNAICHSPMDKYVEGYNSDATPLLATHKASGEQCLDCHEANLQQQVSEGMAWISGDFDDPIKASRLGTVEFCTKCHDDGNPETGMDWEEIVASTEGYADSSRNPHDSHQGMLDCGTCHSMHGKSTMYCQKCHSDLKTPESW